MVRFAIDGREVEVAEGQTVLDGARKLGISIPTLCHRPGAAPLTSCLVCVVRINGAPRLVPSCATRAAEGMQVASEAADVLAARKTALELLLADHAGDCIAPCQMVCPAHMNIPLMLRQIGRGQIHEALVTVKERIPLPAVLGRICPDLCESMCRRKERDEAVSICRLKRFVADADLASASPYLPPCAPPTGKQVAIVGAGPAGLTAAWYLRCLGHAVTIFDNHEQAGGNLRYAIPEEKLPRDVLDSEIRLIEKLGVQFRLNTPLVGPPKTTPDTPPTPPTDSAPEGAKNSASEGAKDGSAGGDKGGRLGGVNDGVAAGEKTPQKDPSVQRFLGVTLDDLRRDFDAVLIACGATDGPTAQALGLPANAKNAQINRDTHATGLPGVFAAGSVIVSARAAIRAVGDGGFAAAAIDAYLHGLPPLTREPEFTTRMGAISADEMAAMMDGINPAPRADGTQGNPGKKIEGWRLPGLSDNIARKESLRCLECGCAKVDTCQFRLVSIAAGADPLHFKGDRRPYEKHLAHPTVVFEPGKCIACGKCVQITEEAREPLGLTFIGRGFTVKVGVPFSVTVDAALTRTAAACVEACPTAALMFKEGCGRESGAQGTQC